MARSEFLDESSFRQFLHLEDKRARRSGKAFILVRIGVSEPFVGADGQRVLQSVVDELGGSLRDTDVCGWHTLGTTIGIIFTESAAGSAVSIGEQLLTDLKLRLASVVPVTAMDTMLRFSFSVFPEAGVKAGRGQSEPEVSKERPVAARR